MQHTLTVFHVGGRGDVGPASCLLGLGGAMSLYIFEANVEGGDPNWDEYDALIKDFAARHGIALTVVPRCLSNTVGKKSRPDMTSVSPRGLAWW